jgi:hypothetical protein
MDTQTNSTVEFELYDRTHRDMVGDNQFNSRAYNVAFCPRCRANHTVFADSASDADEGLGARNMPEHTADECMEYMGEQVSTLTRQLEDLKDEVRNIKDSL